MEANGINEDGSMNRYPALRGLSTIYRILAFLSGLVGLILIIAGFSEQAPLIALYGFMALILGVVVNLTISEGILLFIDIESNTRKTSSLIEQLIFEQADIGQPATRPESKSEGNDKPQPEAEGRSR